MDNFLLYSPTASGTDADDTVYLGNPSATEKLTVLGLYIEPAVTVATHAANYITTTISDGTNTLATHTTNSSGGSALTAGTMKALSLASGAGAFVDIAALGSVKVAVVKSGTGPPYEFRLVAVCKKQR